MSFNVSYNMLHSATQVVSIQDINYEFQPTNSYHPAFLKGTLNRLFRWAGTNTTYKAAILYALSRHAVQNVWAIVFEIDNQPLMVLKNLACPPTSLTFRRILRVNLALLTSDTLGPIQNTLMTVESDPLPSTTTGQ
jgi:hypothetical protein